MMWLTTFSFFKLLIEHVNITTSGVLSPSPAALSQSLITCERSSHRLRKNNLNAIHSPYPSLGVDLFSTFAFLFHYLDVLQYLSHFPMLSISTTNSLVFSTSRSFLWASLPTFLIHIYTIVYTVSRFIVYNLAVHISFFLCVLSNFQCNSTLQNKKILKFNSQGPSPLCPSLSPQEHQQLGCCAKVICFEVICRMTWWGEGMCDLDMEQLSTSEARLSNKVCISYKERGWRLRDNSENPQILLIYILFRLRIP